MLWSVLPSGSPAVLVSGPDARRASACHAWIRTLSQEFSPVSDQSMADLLGRDASKAVRFAGVPDGLYERHLVFDHVIDSRQANRRERFEAVARALRDLLSQRWLQTQQAYNRANAKRVYY